MGRGRAQREVLKLNPVSEVSDTSDSSFVTDKVLTLAFTSIHLLCLTWSGHARIYGPSSDVLVSVIYSPAVHHSVPFKRSFLRATLYGLASLCERTSKTPVQVSALFRLVRVQDEIVLQKITLPFRYEHVDEASIDKVRAFIKQAEAENLC